MNEQLRRLPSVDALLKSSSIGLAHDVAVKVARRVLDDVRVDILSGDSVDPEAVERRFTEATQSLAQSPDTTVINATGVIVQTNLGRSPISAATAAAMSNAGMNYLALETDLASGKRGGRGSEVEGLLQLLTGCERALVVNNNASGVLLTLSALAAGREVIVSRGEAVEIGGGFRVPDVLAQSGANLVDVGTTNRTYAVDYEQAISTNTGAILRVHSSNFTVDGFVAKPELADLARVASQHALPLIDDVGSGCLVNTEDYGLAHEPTLAESIAAGADIVCASGDKLLGGPQAGIIIGKAEYVTRIAKHPLARAVRADKTALAGVAATLRHYLLAEQNEQIPIWQCASRPLAMLAFIVESWQQALDGIGEMVSTESVVGGGSLPGQTIPSRGLALDHPQPNQLAAALRTGTPHVVARVHEGRVILDARTVLEGQSQGLIAAVKVALESVA